MDIKLPRINSVNLTLRPFDSNDRDSLIKLLNDRRISSMMGGFIPHPYTQEDAASYIERHKNDSLSTSTMAFAITLRKTQEIIGNIQIRISDNENEGRLSYWIGVEHWGKGYATEAVKSLLKNLFNNSNLEQINADHFIDNPASGKVLEKCGFLKVSSEENCNLAENISSSKDVFYSLSKKEYLNKSLDDDQRQSYVS